MSSGKGLLSVLEDTGSGKQGSTHNPDCSPTPDVDRESKVNVRGKRGERRKLKMSIHHADNCERWDGDPCMLV